MYSDLDLLDILKENGYKQTSKNLSILKEGLNEGSYIIESEIVFDEDYMNTTLENASKEELFENFKNVYMKQLNLLEMNDTDFSNYIKNCSDSELFESVAILSEDFDDINEKTSTLTESTSNLLESYFDEQYKTLVEAKKEKKNGKDIASYVAPAAGTVAGAGAGHLVRRGALSAIGHAAGVGAKALGWGGAIGLGAGAAAAGAYHLTKKIKKVKDARRNYAKSVDAKDETERKNLDDYAANRSGNQAKRRARRVADAKYEVENRQRIDQDIKNLKKAKGSYEDKADYRALKSAVKRGSKVLTYDKDGKISGSTDAESKKSVVNKAGENAKASYAQGKRIMKLDAAKNNISSVNDKKLNATADARNKAKEAAEKAKTDAAKASSDKKPMTESYSDYELYKLLESSGYKTTNKNLSILKEGLESGKYIITD